ncbi:MAG: site-specific integrase, partial [Acetobacteraceae bacterium]|nr:site-specific integrase [Acetobacteraceae bacterium]
PGGDAGLVLAERRWPHGPLFPSSRGEPYRNLPTHAAKVVAAVAERERRAGRPFRRFRIHDLRHGFAIRALRNGMSLYALSKHLGHSSVRTTEVYLAYLTAGEQAAAVGTNEGTERELRAKRESV